MRGDRLRAFSPRPSSSRLAMFGHAGTVCCGALLARRLENGKIGQIPAIGIEIAGAE
jgi:hypothetical protein